MNFHTLSHAPSNRPTRPNGFRRNSQRGSVLMVALILAGVMALSLTSYLNLSMNAAKMANRSFYMDGAQNLADIGLEQALWSMNNKDWLAGNFAQRAGTLKEYQGTFPSASTYFTLSAGAKGQVKVWADLNDADKPHIVSKATVTLADGSEIIKVAEAYLIQRSYYEEGMVGDTIDMRGQVTGDSWSSDPDNDPSTPPIPYSAAVASDNTKFAATAVIANALSGGQGQIRGAVSVGSSEAGGGLTLGSQGTVGDNAWVNAGNRGVQEGHATYDYTASFPDEKNPVPPAGTVVSTLVSASTQLPRRNASGVIIDTPASDGYYYYTIPEIDLGGNTDTLHISGGKVIITTTNTTGVTVNATGNRSGIVIDNGSALKLYTAGDVRATGNGILNGGNGVSADTANQPINFQLYGTRSANAAAISGDQIIDIKGNGYLSGVIYAPNGDVTLNGNGAVLGAAVGDTVVFTGNAAFHYDDSLPKTLVTGLWKLRKWRELSTATERSTYETQLAF